jgi:hypothetical protein
MGLLNTEILSNRFDVENSLNNSMNERAMAFGALDRTAYAPMTASTALQGDMQGQSIGGMLGGRQIAMQKQDIIDDIMKRNPNPRTSTELRDVANEFAQAGLTDYSFQITEVANELYKSEFEKNVAPEKFYSGISNTLGNEILTSGVLNLYAQSQFGIPEDEWKEMTVSQKDVYIKRARQEIQGQIDNYANRKRMDGMSKTGVKALMQDQSKFFQDFYADLTKYGSTNVSSFLKSITNFDSTIGTGGLKINPELFFEINDDELKDMDVGVMMQRVDQLENELAEKGTLSKTKRDNLKKLQEAIQGLGNGNENEVNSLYEKIKGRSVYEGMNEQQIKNLIRRSLGIPEQEARLEVSNDGTRMAMANDNFSSWIVPSSQGTA